MNENIEKALAKLKVNNMKRGKSVTCGRCVAFFVREDEYRCSLKPFCCDDTGHPLTNCPKPLSQAELKKVKDLLAD